MRFFKARVGGEWIGPGIGLEIGPTLIVDHQRRPQAYGPQPYVRCPPGMGYRCVAAPSGPPPGERYGTYLGLGIVPWAGYSFFVYYDYTLIFARAPNLHALGAELKTPLLGFGGGDAHDDDWD